MGKDAARGSGPCSPHAGDRVWPGDLEGRIYLNPILNTTHVGANYRTDVNVLTPLKAQFIYFLSVEDFVRTT